MSKLRFNQLMYGPLREVEESLCGYTEPETVSHVELIAALGNAIREIVRQGDRIAKLEERLAQNELNTRQAANVASCLANGIQPD